MEDFRLCTFTTTPSLFLLPMNSKFGIYSISRRSGKLGILDQFFDILKFAWNLHSAHEDDRAFEKFGKDAVA